MRSIACLYGSAYTKQKFWNVKDIRCLLNIIKSLSTQVPRVKMCTYITNWETQINTHAHEYIKSLYKNIEDNVKWLEWRGSVLLQSTTWTYHVNRRCTFIHDSRIWLEHEDHYVVYLWAHIHEAFSIMHSI